MNKRFFKVIDSSGLPFYHAPGALCKNFDGMVLEFIQDIPSLEQVVLKQPEQFGHLGTVSLDYKNVLESEL